jgi:hypothetical protein
VALTRSQIVLALRQTSCTRSPFTWGNKAVIFMGCSSSVSPSHEDTSPEFQQYEGQLSVSENEPDPGSVTPMVSDDDGCNSYRASPSEESLRDGGDGGDEGGFD